MFTGIIETTAQVQKRSQKKIVISRPEIFSSLSIGQSIAVNGACLSVAKFDDQKIFFDVMSETFRRTNLSEAKTVNVERAMPANGRFEGHIVLGHVDTVVSLLKKTSELSGIQMIFSLPEEKKFLVEKGSISLNGVSLTLGKINEEKNSFSVFLIPLTIAHTNLGSLSLGEKVTVEYDYLSKFMIKK